ncbi:MAG: aminoacyl-tRNA hydrolase [Alphaproteobacteria bacterium]|jgi:PTH1 family peptidyl-tRNA hydrolase
MQKNKPILIVGLGNPGTAYLNTRHNVGFMAVDALAGTDAVWKKEKKSLVSKTENVIFAKPQTFMNLSGLAVQALMTFYKIPLENLVVIHDDIDLKIGDVREKTGGGSAGHNGIKSIDAAVGRDYHRIRIGVGRSNQPMDTSDWVLGRFSSEDLEIINNTIKKISDNFCF